jgi:hypothetical protein
MFNQWKSYLKRFQLDFTTENWRSVHTEALKSITPVQGMNYFKTNTLTYLIENHPNYPPYQEELLLLLTTIMVTAQRNYMNK